MNGPVKNNLSLFQILALYAFISNYLEHIKSCVIRSALRSHLAFALIAFQVVWLQRSMRRLRQINSRHRIRHESFGKSLPPRLLQLHDMSQPTCRRWPVSRRKRKAVLWEWWPKTTKTTTSRSKTNGERNPFDGWTVCQNMTSINFIPRIILIWF